ncbi:MAG TPA: DUF6268 family outer membrane beta-barrel protein [Chthoniobacterales bacterium]
MRLVRLAAGLVVLVGNAFGGEATIQAPLTQPTPAQGPLWSFDLNGSYVSGSQIQNAHNFGSQAEFHHEFEALRNFHLFDKYYLQVGIDYDRYDFSRSNSIFPYALSGVAGEAGISYWDGDDFFPLLTLKPGVYFTRNHITRNSFDIPVRAAGGVKVQKKVHLVLGFEADAYQEIPVFPVAGLNWEITDKVNLRAVFPEPRLSYNPNKQLEIFISGEVGGGSYRNGPTDDRRTNNAILEYTEDRAGTGVSYNPRKGISFEASAGWSIQRRFNYFRAGPDYSSKGAPYVKLDLSIDLF